ncbi:type-1 angiotensin II receptor-associated protein isoform X3 [Austrofundulus limnaeus]|uniref:Type-1 angiotensin II receptor-associated protein isoform X3 n=1 Tax=Austrofundulus limnaeus TaxID=52670 RepID=A0A2I4BUT9_AUSLI|nr:PREDICTED: type-1 angiotensin II receptor-associated protein isoform X3 [Austrofundulus limnaeus]
MEIPAINLKAIVLVHWLLTVWGCMAGLPISYALGNLSVLAVGVWAIAQRDSIDAVLLGVVRFSAGMAILSLLLKPVSCFFVYQMYRERGGDYNVNFGFPSVTRNRDTYQSIDQQEGSSSPANPFNQAQDGKPGVRAY